MNISYTNGTSLVTTYSDEKFTEAIKNPNVAKVSVYVPGTEVTIGERRYTVGKAGNLIRIRD